MTKINDLSDIPEISRFGNKYYRVDSYIDKYPVYDESGNKIFYEITDEHKLIRCYEKEYHEIEGNPTFKSNFAIIAFTEYIEVPKNTNII